MTKKNLVIQTGVVVGSANITASSGDVKTAGNVFVGNALTITGNTLAANIYQQGNRVLDTTTTFQTIVTRQDYAHTTPAIEINQFYEFEIPLGVSFIVYRLMLSRPCRIEVFGTADKTEPNPYTFIATADHLVDDGSILLNDGSIIQSRQYSIFANLETPAQPKVYARISNTDNSITPVTVSLVYFTGVMGVIV
jgi:hypothetical protein